MSMEFGFEISEKLPEPTENTMDNIYLIESKHNIFDKYITVRSGSDGNYIYSWVNIGSEDISEENERLNKNNKVVIFIFILLIIFIVSIIRCMIFGVGDVVYMFSNPELTITQVIIERIFHTNRWKWICVAFVSYILIKINRNKLK